MVQSIDNGFNRANYSAVKININKPEVFANGANNQNPVVTNPMNVNGNNVDLNAVNINIDNPTVHAEPVQPIYDYPQAQMPMTYDMAQINQIPLPQGFNLAYHTTNVILPKMENELEVEGKDFEPVNDLKTPDEQKIETPNVPEPNYTTTEVEKGVNVGPEETVPTSENVEKRVNVGAEETLPTSENVEKGVNIKAEDTVPAGENSEKTENAGAEEVIPTSDEVKEDAPENDVDVEDVPEEVEETENAEEAEEAPAVAEDDTKNADKINDDVKVMDSEVKEIEKKKPEIIPGEEIKPDVDIPLVISNLTNADYDVQAQQMEEIARISMDNPENAVPYIVRDVFATLIDITKADTSELASPTEAQVQARKKVIANYLVMENAKGDKNVKLPYELSDAEIELANQISPMEQAERNKEYAMYTMSVLAKIYTDEVEKQTGNIVPMTDLPGTSAIVDALRYNPNPEVKLAAIDALSHIERPEYKDELTTLFTLAQTDTNPLVAMAATRAIERAAQDDSAQ